MPAGLLAQAKKKTVRKKPVAAKKSSSRGIGYMNVWENKPPEFNALLKTTGLNAAIKLTKDLNSDVSCDAAGAIGEFGVDGEKAVPALVSLIKRSPQQDNYCAEHALFRIGDKGRTFLSPERLKQIENIEKDMQVRSDRYLNSVKPIQPKAVPEKPKLPDSF
jgi:hypothetical protein